MICVNSHVLITEIMIKLLLKQEKRELKNAMINANKTRIMFLLQLDASLINRREILLIGLEQT